MELSVKHSQSCLKTLPLVFIIVPERHTDIHVIPTHVISSSGRQTSSLLSSPKMKQRQGRWQWGILQKWPPHPAGTCNKGHSRSSWQWLAQATSQTHRPAVLEHSLSCWFLLPGRCQPITPWSLVHSTAYDRVTSITFTRLTVSDHKDQDLWARTQPHIMQQIFFTGFTFELVIVTTTSYSCSSEIL